MQILFITLQWHMTYARTFPLPVPAPARLPSSQSSLGASPPRSDANPCVQHPSLLAAAFPSSSWPRGCPLNISFSAAWKTQPAQKKAAAPIAPGSLGADETGWECAGALLTLCAHLLVGVLGLFKPLMGSGIV